MSLKGFNDFLSKSGGLRHYDKCTHKQSARPVQKCACNCYKRRFYDAGVDSVQKGHKRLIQDVVDSNNLLDAIWKMKDEFNNEGFKSQCLSMIRVFSKK